MNRRLGSLIAAGVLATLPALAGPPPNFGVVVENGIYRGGQPRKESFEHLRKLGVRTVLKLNHHDLDIEQAEAKRLGMTLIQIPFDAGTIGQPGTCGDVARALSILTDQSNWPVYVHCTLGRDRTGYIVGAYRVLVQRWNWARVDKELAAYGQDDDFQKTHPLIPDELKSGLPSCADRLGRAAAPTSMR